MDTTYQGFRAYYAQLTDDDLRQIAVSAADLVEDAQRALTAELAKRGMASPDTTPNKPETQSDTNSAALAVIPMIPWLFCMWNYYGDHLLFAPYDKQAVALSFFLAVMALHWGIRRSRDGRRASG